MNTNLATVIPFREKTLYVVGADDANIQKIIKKPPVSTKMECLYNEEQIKRVY